MKPLFILFSLVAFSCTRYTPGIEETLSLAGSNRGELKKVLRHYEQNPGDSLKYKAACFLIDNMKWHISTEQAAPLDSTIYQYHAKFDHLYECVTRELPDTSLGWKIQDRLWEFSITTSKLIEVTPLDTPTVIKGLFPDPKHISSDFLISHVDNAFRAWHESPHASFLTFEEFEEQILPYRSITGYPFFDNGKKLNDMFGKILGRSTEKDFKGYVTRYCHYTNTIRSLFGLQLLTTHVGIYDLFLGYKADCISMANNLCNVFRANGLPTAIDYNISYREKVGRHFHCVLTDSTGRRYRFNVNANFDKYSPLEEPSMNIFRNTFGAQPDSPFLLKAKDESLPDYFDTPCIKEVTGEAYEVARVELPIKADIPNNMAYLYAFNNNPTGIIPATWGTIDKLNKRAIFKNVMFNTLYFPVYLQNDTTVAFAEPFYLTSSDSLPGGYTINSLPGNAKERKGSLLLLRKYPPKLYLQECARRMIGGRFEGANRDDFSDAVLLYTIKEAPILNLQEYTPTRSGPFLYYCYVAPDQYPTSNVAILQFLTDEYTAQDSLKGASPLPVFSPDKIEQALADKKYARLRGSVRKSPDIIYNQAFDDNMLTVAYEKANVMPLDRPMTVKKIRMAPSNAMNHIVAGDTYQLMYWDGKWKSAGYKRAHYNFLAFDDVPLDKIYWLRDLSTGNEELPFIYQDGKQKFIYHDILQPEENESK